MNYLLPLIVLFTFSTGAWAQGATDLSTSEASMEEKMYLGHASYEYYSPDDRTDFNLQGVNLGVQYNYKFEDSLIEMVMGPNLSLLTEDKNNTVEDVVLLKWDHGISYTFEFGDNVLLKPLFQVGIGYGWLNSKRDNITIQNDENDLLYEALIGANLIPTQDFNVFAKGGYRFFEVDDVGATNTGELQGIFAVAGIGMNF